MSRLNRKDLLVKQDKLQAIRVGRRGIKKKARSSQIAKNLNIFHVACFPGGPSWLNYYMFHFLSQFSFSLKYYIPHY